jgi:hypothetical protein
MTKWMPMFAVPNLVLRDPIDVEGFALAPAGDERVVEMMRKNRRFGSFMMRFKTEFGDAIEPSVIIWRNDMPDSYRTISAISGFRDLVSMCVIPLAWALVLRFGSRTAALYSDYFSVYPWMTDNQDRGLITRTPAMLGVHEVRRLRASSIPALPPHILESREIDRPMLKELLRRWERCFATDKPSTDDERLFRSLNMANAAAMLPSGADSKLYDALRSVALWASAFEIMRPAKNQAFKSTYELLEGIKWNSTPCTEEKYHAYGDPKDKLRALPSWLFGEINHLRNDTLHGNPLPEGRTIVAPGKRPINIYAAPLYRMALAAYIELKFVKSKPRAEGSTDYEDFLDDQHEFGHFQRDIEAALSTVMLTEEEYRHQRTRLPARRSATLPA